MLAQRGFLGTKKIIYLIRATLDFFSFLSMPRKVHRKYMHVWEGWKSVAGLSVCRGQTMRGNAMDGWMACMGRAFRLVVMEAEMVVHIIPDFEQA